MKRLPVAGFLRSGNNAMGGATGASIEFRHAPQENQHLSQHVKRCRHSKWRTTISATDYIHICMGRYFCYPLFASTHIRART